MNDASNIRWGDVRQNVRDELAGIQAALMSAPLAEVRMLQARAQALCSVISWFESAAPDDRAITDPAPSTSPMPGY